MYLFNVAIGLDIFASDILGGMPGETLSGRAGTARAKGKLRGKIFAPLIDLLFWNKNHCASAVLGDIARAKAVIADDSQ
jgi:hypothetical protein